MGRQESAFPPCRPVMVRARGRSQGCSLCLNFPVFEPATAFTAPSLGVFTTPVSSPESSSESLANRTSGACVWISTRTASCMTKTSRTRCRTTVLETPHTHNPGHVSVGLIVSASGAESRAVLTLQRFTLCTWCDTCFPTYWLPCDHSASTASSVRCAHCHAYSVRWCGDRRNTSSLVSVCRALTTHPVLTIPCGPSH